MTAPEVMSALEEARDQLWHLSKDKGENYLVCQMNTAIEWLQAFGDEHGVRWSDEAREQAA